MNTIKRAIRRFSRRLLEITDDWEPVERVLSEELEAELLRHPGEWVAMTHDRLISVGDTPAEVLATAHAEGVAAPILYRVPDPGTTYFLATTSA